MRDSTYRVKIVSHGALLSWYLFEEVEGEMTRRLAASFDYSHYHDSSRHDYTPTANANVSAE
jgi:hypothetical protein